VRSFFVLDFASAAESACNSLGRINVQHDPLLRAIARAIYDACYPTDDRAPSGFDEAERTGPIHYRQSVDAAYQARALMLAKGEQLALFEVA